MSLIVALAAPASAAAGGPAAGPGFRLETPLSTQAVFAPGETDLPGVVTVTAQPVFRATSDAAPGRVVSPDAVVDRASLGSSLPPDAPFQLAGSLDVVCSADPVDVPVYGNFLGRYTAWSALTAGTPYEGWQGHHHTEFWNAGAVIFPDQAPQPGGRFVVNDHLASVHPILPRSQCGADVDSRTLADFHSVTLAAADGDVSYKGGDILGEARFRFFDGWQGSIFGWFDAPGRGLTVEDKFVTDPATGKPQMRMRIVATRSGRWRSSEPSPYGPTWEWSFSGFNIFNSDLAGDGSSGTEESASLQVMPGQRVLALLPGAEGPVTRTYVSPGFGTAVMTPDGVEFRDVLRVPARSLGHGPAAPLPSASGQGVVSIGSPLGGYCAHSIDQAEPAGNLCLGFGADGAGAFALTELSMDEDVNALSGGLPFIEMDGVRHKITPDLMTDPPFFNEYQYGSYPNEAPSVVVSAQANFAVAGAKFTLAWVIVRDRVYYGKFLYPALVRYRGPNSKINLTWYARPAFAGRARTVIEEGYTRTPVPVAATAPARGGFLTGSDYWWIRDEGSAEPDAYYIQTTAGYQPSGLAGVSHDSRTTFLSWHGAPTPTPLQDSLTDPLLESDVGIFKQDFYESSFGSRLYSDVLGPYGMLLTTAPYGIGIY